MGVVDQFVHKACGIVAFFIWGAVGLVVLAMYLAGPPDTDNLPADHPPEVEQVPIMDQPD